MTKTDVAKTMDQRFDDLRGTRVWRSIFRSGTGSSTLKRALAIQQNVFLHLFSTKVRTRMLSFSATWYLGTLTLGTTAGLTSTSGNGTLTVVLQGTLGAVNAALKEAIDKGITVVAIDQGVTQAGAYVMSNDQVNYGYLGAKWLFTQLKGTGKVIYMRGAAGATADNDRDTGFKMALAENPGITVVKEVATGWDPAKGTQEMNDILSSGIAFDGIWTSGIDNVIVDALKTAGHPFVPIVGADNAGFVKQLLTEPGLVGAAVTNPASVGGAGLELAFKIMDGQKPANPAVHVTPVVWDNTTDAGKASLTAANDPAIDASWPLGITIPGQTTYTKAQILACKGPGE